MCGFVQDVIIDMNKKHCIWLFNSGTKHNWAEWQWEAAAGSYTGEETLTVELPFICSAADIRWHKKKSKEV